jgi:hypothetical protein
MYNSEGIVRSRTKATELVECLMHILTDYRLILIKD